MKRGIGLAAAVLGLALLAGCGQAPEKPGVDGKLPAGVMPLRYGLALTIDPRQARFSGEARIRLKFEKRTRSFWVHGRDLKVNAASLSPATGPAIEATYSENGAGFAEVRLAHAAPAGEAMLIIAYDAPFNENAAGLYHSTSGDDQYAVTQFESIDARRAFPSFDQPNFKTPYDVTIIARAADTVIANTGEAKAEPAATGW